MPDHSLAVVDRNFFSARTLIGIERGGIQRHWLTRAKSNLVCTRIERFAVGDEMVAAEVVALYHERWGSSSATTRSNT